MPTVLERVPKARFPCLTTHFGPITPLFGAGLAFRGRQNFAGSGLCALSGHSERRVARADQHDGRFPSALIPRADLLGQKIAFR